MAERAGETFLGLDIGTSSVKALLVDGAQRVVAEASSRSAFRALMPCGASRTRRTGSRASRRRSPRSAAKPQTNSPRCPASACRARCTARRCSTRTTSLLRPAILWNDGRSFAECAELKRRVPDLAAAHRQSRHARLHRAEAAVGRAPTSPRSSKATRRVLLPKDYVRLRLSGEAVSEMSDASGTLWLDVGRRRWDEAPARGDRPHRKSHAGPGRGFGGFGASRAGRRRRLGPRRAQGSDRGRRRRQRRLGDRRRRDRRRERASSRSAPRASSFRSPTASCACPSARCMRSATRCRIAGTGWR